MKINTRQMILVGLFAALTAIGAFIQTPLGAVPVTLQFLFTALAGILLGARLGALSQFVYIIVGLLGVPIFAGGKAGFSAVISPTFGYLIGFILGAYAIGKIAQSNEKPGFLKLLVASLTGIVIIYAIGVPYLYLIMNNVIGKNITFSTAFKTGCFIFIPGDLLKGIIAAVLGTKVVPSVRKASV